MSRRISVFVSISSIFTALTAALTYLVHIPSPTGGYTHIGDTVIYLSALLFGPVVGLVVGAVGPLIADLLVGYPRWYVTIIAHGLQGYIAGFGRGKRLKTQVMLIVIAGLLMSFTYFTVNVYIKGPAPALISLARDIFGQSLISWVLSVLLLKPLEESSIIQKAASMV